jgi:hypothetical protein
VPWLVLVRLDGARLWIKTPDGAVGELDSDYQLGAVFGLKMEAGDGRVRIYYNDSLRADFSLVHPSCYFKAGVYLQSNRSWGDGADAGGEVTVYSLTVSHS